LAGSATTIAESGPGAGSAFRRSEQIAQEATTAVVQPDDCSVGGVYQAWVALQFGQPTDVETGASNTNPHWQW
jgi:hypothetical protein